MVNLTYQRSMLAVLYKGMYADGVFYFNGESLASLHLSIRENVRQ